MKFTIASVTAVFVTASVPFIASAQTVTDIPSLFSLALDIINGYVVPLIFAVAFIVFLIGIYRYFIQGGGNSEKVAEGRMFLLWSLIGFFILFSVWGLVNLFVGTFGFEGAAQPGIPTFTNTSNSTNPLNSLFPTGTDTSGNSVGTGADSVNCPAGSTPSGNGGCVSLGGSPSSATATTCTDGSTVPAGSVCVSCGNGVTSANNFLCPTSSSNTSGSINGVDNFFGGTSNGSSNSAAATCTDGSPAPANDASLCTSCDCGVTSSSEESCAAYCGD